MPEPFSFQTTRAPLRSLMVRNRLSERTANMPGAAYIAVMTLSLVGGRPTPSNSSCATSPDTMPMSISPASSLGAFSVEPLLGARRISRLGSTVRMASWKASA